MSAPTGRAPRLSAAAGLLSLAPMSDTNLADALARLDRAVSRLERVQLPAPAAPGLASAYAELDERHGLLRLRIQETIERLDALIEREAIAG
jgi:hypothetical protein